jgi:hypothetical protein
LVGQLCVELWLDSGFSVSAFVISDFSLRRNGNQTKSFHHQVTKATKSGLVFCSRGL